MDDVFWVAFGLAVVGGVIGAIVRGLNAAAGQINAGMTRNRQERAARTEEVRQRSERRALELVVEFPGLDDAEIAQLMRDELMNMRSAHHEYYGWATAETVGRMRRTLFVEAVRRSRES